MCKFKKQKAPAIIAGAFCFLNLFPISNLVAFAHMLVGIADFTALFEGGELNL